MDDENPNSEIKLPPAVEKVYQVINAALDDNELVAEALRDARNEGFEVSLFIGYTRPDGEPPPPPLPELKEPKPLVKDGEVIPGFITQQDRHLVEGWIDLDG
jgi:hypothetical protein